MTTLHIDFETRSTIDLKVAGLDNYARHPTTDVWCMAYALGDEEVSIWRREDELPHAAMLAYVRNGGTVVAHNSSFEIAIWNNVMVPRYGWPPLRPEQTRCTMAAAYSMALPGSLEKAAAAVGIAEQKDMAGGRLMLQMSRPRGTDVFGEPIWWDSPEKLEGLYSYCKTDVRVERALEKRLVALSDDEQALWLLDHRINNRGIAVDTPAVKAAIAIVQHEQDRLNQEMRRVTGNFVGFCSEVARIGKWLQTQGVHLDGLAKADVLDALGGGLPPAARRALELRREAGKTSTAKLTAMVEAASADGRVRNTIQYHAAGTGRFGGRRIQPQNFPRPKLKYPDIEDAIHAITTMPTADAAAHLSLWHGSPLDVISSCLRSLLIAAPGNDLLAADFSAIESRALAWLSGEEWKLEAFRAFDAGKGPDIYKMVAAGVLGKDPSEITDDERQASGKVPELACGYQGGVGAFQTMARNYGVKISDDKADAIKTAWREKCQNTVNYWYALEDAALRAVADPGLVTSAGPKGRQVKYRVRGSFLWCLLPSGRTLCYPYPKLKVKTTAWGADKEQVHYMTVDGLSGKWVETSTYGGKLAENVTQAVCRDLLVAGIRNVEAAGYPVVLHVHDEIVSEVAKGFGDLKEFEALCARTPAWADGLPVVASGWRSGRYKK